MRADLYLVKYNHTESRQKAAAHIRNGEVCIDGRVLSKPSFEIDETAEHTVEVKLTEADLYVSRGALKLRAALESFEIDVNGKVCVDIGASTGGFTDCLLQNGASRVYAFDSGRDQLHPRIAGDKRVVSKEGFNARYITPNDVGCPADIIVMDVSFISQTLIIPQICDLLKDGGSFISLIKPQFEAGKGAIQKNGIVKKAEARVAAVNRVYECAASVDLKLRGLIPSPIKGGDGNEEYLALFVKDQTDDADDIAAINQLIKTAVKGSR